MLAGVFGAGRSFDPDSPNGGGSQDSVLVTSHCKDCRGGGKGTGHCREADDSCTGAGDASAGAEDAFEETKGA